MYIFTPNTLIKSAEINANFASLTTGDTSWVAPTFTNNWVNYDSTYNQCGYYKDSLGWVHLRGLVKNGTDGASIFTLPVGYRPQYRELLAGASEEHYGRIDVPTDGTVIPNMNTTAPGWVCLDGLLFKAYQ